MWLSAYFNQIVKFFTQKFALVLKVICQKSDDSSLLFLSHVFYKQGIYTATRLH